MRGSIYYLTDETNIPRYVGKTLKSLKERLYFHIYEKDRHHTHKNNWIKSKDKKDLKIVLIGNYDLELLNEMEIYWIQIYKNLGYKLTNGTDGGDSGYKYTEEVSKKISIVHKGKKVSDEIRKKISNSLKGNVPVNKGKLMSEEQKIKISESQKGRKHSEETKRKISETSKLNMSDERRMKISKTLKGKIFSENTKIKISEAKKKWWMDKKNNIK